MAQEKLRMKKVLSILEKTYPDSKCSLEFNSPFQLLVATILSAQCTDERVNKVTPVLFARFPTAEAMAKGKLAEIEDLVKSTGFYKNKARGISESAKIIVKKHAGEVPRTLDELTHLRGVGRKTANVVLGNAYGIPGLVVDTHVGRLARRLGFTKATDPEKVEQEMMELVPKKKWTIFSHFLISHVRATCQARRAFCNQCVLVSLCPKSGLTL